MADTTSKIIQSEQINDPWEINMGLRVFADVASCGIAEAGFQGAENAWKDYLNDQDLLTQYEQSLNSIAGQIEDSQYNIISNQWKLEDLAHDKTVAEDFLEDYRQMLAGEGDSDNTLLLQDQYNQQQIELAENQLAAYKDSSALELDSLIQSGFEQYNNQRQEEALLNIYASASGSVIGAYGSAARRTQFAIRAFVGDDMRFNEAADGTSVLNDSTENRIGSFAKSMLAARTTVKNNIAQLESVTKAAQIAFLDFREQVENAAYEKETFLDRYDTTVAMYQHAIAKEQQNIKDLQNSALAIIEASKDTLDRLNDYEGDDVNKTTWEGLDELYEQYGGTRK